METTEITEMLAQINDMHNIHTVEIELGDISIKVTKSKPANDKVNNQVTETTKFIPPAVFAPAKDFETDPNRPKHLASIGQVKFATDLAEKLSPGNPNNVVNFLAHALELPLEEIPLPDTWIDIMTKEMAGLYLDILDHEHKKQRKQQGGY